MKNCERKTKGKFLIGKNEPARKLNKRILKKKKESRRNKIALIVFFVIVTSPLWLYAGFVCGVMLPLYGERTKGTLTGIRVKKSWSKYRHDPPRYYCTFNVNNKVYASNSSISVNDTSFHLGDTIEVIYFKRMPFVNALNLTEEERK